MHLDSKDVGNNQISYCQIMNYLYQTSMLHATILNKINKNINTVLKDNISIMVNENQTVFSSSCQSTLAYVQYKKNVID